LDWFLFYVSLLLSLNNKAILTDNQCFIYFKNLTFIEVSFYSYKTVF